MSQSFKRLEKVREAGERNRMVAEMERGRGTVGEVLRRRSRIEVREERMSREIKRGKSPIFEAKERARNDK